MRTVAVFLGLVLAAIVILFSLIHIAEGYLLVMLAVAVLLIGAGVSTWRDV